MSAGVERQGPSEAFPLAREMARAVRELVEFYKEEYGLSRQEAVAKVNEPAGPGEDDTALRGPPDEVAWADLHKLFGRDAGRAVARWEEVKQAARDEVRSGHRGAKVVERGGGPCGRRPSSWPSGRTCWTAGSPATASSGSCWRRWPRRRPPWNTGWGC
jgi:hypothetical protein